MSISRFGSYKLSAFFLLIMLSLTVYIAFAARERSNNLAYKNFINHTDSLVDEILEREQSYLTVLRGTKGFFGSSEIVTREEWNNYVKEYDIENKFKGIQGLAYAPVVSSKKINEHENRYRNLLGDTNYSLFSEEEKRYYMPIVYVAPFSGTNPDAVGFDIFLEGAREAAIEHTINTGTISNSGKVFLKQKNSTDEEPGFILYLSLPESEQQEKSITNTKGVILLGFRMEKFLEGILPLNNNLVRMSIYDKDTTSDNLLYTNYEVNNISSNMIVNNQSIQIGDREWIINFQGDNNFGLSFLERNLAYLILCIGLLVSLFTTLLFYLSSSREMQANKIADGMLQSFKLEKKRVEEERNKIKTIIDSLGDGLIVVDAKGIINLVNPAALDILGKKEHELIGKKHEDALHLVTANNVPIASSRLPISKVITTSNSFSDSTKIFYLENQEENLTPLSISAAPILSDSSLVGVAQVFRDITELERIDRAKTEFVSLASHQLRTPLTAIEWYTEMLINNKDHIPKKQQKFLDEIQEGGKRMVELVDSLLNVSRIELGSFAVDPVELSISSLLKEVKEEVSAIADDKKIKIVSKVLPLDLLYKADKSLLKIVISNLLTNAVKYSDEHSEVEVIIELKDAFILTVTDHGRGIPENEQQHIFEKMFRATNALTTDTTGTGLGLYIIKAIVEQSNGTISFVSKENNGSVFTVVLPKEGMTKKEGSKPLI